MHSFSTRLRADCSPVLAVALHAGHELRTDVAQWMALDNDIRLREEDPYTEIWTQAAPSWAVAHHSRFEVDLNRPRELAVYRTPEEAWGLKVWKGPLPDAIFERSLQEYDAFYAALGDMLDRLIGRWGAVVVLDLHTYNHRRGSCFASVADAAGNPEVNLGTGSMDRAFWAPVVERFAASLAGVDYFGRRLDVRENVRFQGGAMARWIHATYPHAACCLAIEVRKFFMDEWTGIASIKAIHAFTRALRTAVPDALGALHDISPSLQWKSTTLASM